ncbi:HD-GYP domain-containing protein [Pseudomarimonas arenosa]|nr:HD domain-containing phosphohydrolase [Pseudomarimonas arenosa]
MIEQLLQSNDVKVHALQERLSEQTYFHSLNVAVLCLTLGRALELSVEELQALGMGAVFHDAGQTLLPSQLLNRSTPMNRAEQRLFESHCQEGLRLGQIMELPAAAMDILQHHHEMLDGSGYPEGLKGEQISKLVRIVAIVNHYDDLCNTTLAGAAVSPSEALSQMFAFKRNQLDDTLLRLFIRCLGVYPPGSIVALSNERIGMVLAVNQQSSLKPTLLIYDPSVPPESAPMLDLRQTPELKIVRAVKISLLPREVFQYLCPRQHVTYFFDPQRTEATQ